MRNHYNIENLKRALRNPRLIAREVVRIGSLPFHRGYGVCVNYRTEEGIDVMTEEWDNLIILDACRYDYFEKQHSIPGTLKVKTSRGNKRWEFMQENFAGRQFHDTVYITANPFVTRLDDDTFYAVDTLSEYWDNEIGTIHPEDVSSVALEANQRYPNKRLIIHFMQPHRPYLGEMAQRLRERVDLVGYRNEGEGLQIWGAVKEGHVTVEEVRTAYIETLDIVLDEVESLLEALDGKSVITSDHGEMLGERVLPFTSRVWGHSEGFSTPELRRVPWHEVEYQERRTIKQDEPIANAKLGEHSVKERLTALGYRDE